MDPNKKQEIMDDLETFTKSKEYYAKIGKAWKRGYLLYGPPGTGQREKKKEEKKEVKDEKDAIKEEVKKLGPEKKQSEVTLSGLLNFIDGLWSAIVGERLIVFTTNFVEKLDPALIRRGRMDKHIELPYCCFESFKVLAKNYLDVESHDHFPEIRRLLEETNMTPADVAENLMGKSSNENVDTCLERLIKALETTKEEARLKAKEEKRAKVEKEKGEKEKEKEAKYPEPVADELKENGKLESNGVKEDGDASKV